MIISLPKKALLSMAGISMLFLMKAQEKPAARAEELAKKLSNPL